MDDWRTAWIIPLYGVFCFIMGILLGMEIMATYSTIPEAVAECALKILEENE